MCASKKMCVRIRAREGRRREGEKEGRDNAI